MGMTAKRAMFAAAGVLAVTLVTGCIPPTEPSTTTTTEPRELLVDQENNPTEFTYSDGFVLASCGYQDPIRQIMQTFTAGRTGTLERVSLPLYTYVSDPPPLIVTVHPLLGPNAPDLSVELGRGTYDGPGLGEYTFQTFAAPAGLLDIPMATPAPVVAGSQYALLTRVDLAECDDGQASWTAPTRLGPVDHYLGGAHFYWNSHASAWVSSTSLPGDEIFQTWVR